MLPKDATTPTEERPSVFYLGQNYPNPFNPVTFIRYQLADACQVTITIFNLLGQDIFTLIDKHQPAGYYSVRWDGRDNWGNRVPSGVYLYRMTAGNFVQSQKMAIMR